MIEIGIPFNVDKHFIDKLINFTNKYVSSKHSTFLYFWNDNYFCYFYLNICKKKWSFRFISVSNQQLHK